MGLDVLFELSGAFEIHCLGLVVYFAVSENFHDVVAELLTVPVFAVAELFLDCFEIDRLFDHQMVIRNVL